MTTDIALIAKGQFVALQLLPSEGPDVMRTAGETDLGRKRRLKNLFATQHVLCKANLEAQDG